MESMGFSDTLRMTMVVGSRRGNYRTKTLYNQRDLKNQRTHICHFTVEETTGDPERSRVTKLMISNAKRSFVNADLLFPKLIHLLKAKFNNVQGRLHLKFNLFWIQRC